MTTMKPTPEQLAQWLHLGDCNKTVHGCSAEYSIENTARLAYAAGADAELKACCEVVSHWAGDWHKDIDLPTMLRSARRLKPRTLKEEALRLLEIAERSLIQDQYIIIRSALQSIPDS
jgi:hypothetical protein